MISYSQDGLMDERNARLQSHSAFYQYQPVNNPNDDRLAGLEKGKLWMSDPARFNDPLDLRLPIKDLSYRGPFDDEDRLMQAVSVLMDGNHNIENYWLYDRPLLETFKGWMEGHSPSNEIIRGVERRFRAFGVACFTRDFNNPLMWAHYADQHGGFCVEYAVRKLGLVAANPSFSQCYVQYVTELPHLCLSEVLFSPHQVMHRMLATKTVEWAYEREWRLVHHETKGGKVAMPQYMQISALIAGFKMEPEKLEKLKATAIRLGVPAMKMRQKYGYELALEELA